MDIRLTNYIKDTTKLLLRVSLINIFSRIFGFLKYFSIAVLLGYSYQTDAVFLALSLVGIFIVLSEAFDTVGMRKSIQLMNTDELYYKHYITNLFIFAVSCGLTILLLGFLLAFIVEFIWFIPEYIRNSQALKLSIMFFSMYSSLNFLFYFLGLLTRIKKRFLVYFISEFIFYFLNFLFITVGLLIKKSYYIIPLAFPLAMLFSIAFLFIANKSHIKYIMKGLEKNLLVRYIKIDFKSMSKELLATSSAYSALYVYSLVDKLFALHVGEKALSAINYGFLLATSLWNVIRLERIAIVNLTESLLVDKDKFTKELKQIFTLLLLVSAPFIAIFYIFPEYVVKTLFGYGFFSAEDISLTSEALKYYAFSVPFTLLWPLIFRVLIVLNFARFLIFISLSTVVLNVVLNYIFVFILSLGIKGLCIATFICYLVLTFPSILFIRGKLKAREASS